MRRVNHSPAAAALTAFGSSQYSDQLRKGPSSSRYYSYLNGLDSELSAPPRPLVHEYRGWNRESDLHSVPFGMRGTETVEPYASPIVGSSRLSKDEPLVPRPTFIRPISASSSASGSGSSCAYSSTSAAPSKLTSKPPTSNNKYPPAAPSSTASAAHFSISAHELYCGESKVFPNGSPYHCLRSDESLGSGHATGRAANFYDNNRRRPKSVAADSSEGQLDWSAEIVRH